MRSVTATAYARAGLLGNPSDIYGGRVLAFTFRDRSARVWLDAAEGIEIVSEPGGGLHAVRLGEVVAPGVAGRQQGGAALLAAATKKLTDQYPYLLSMPADDDRLRFRMACASDIPRQVGLAGSSAIVVAALRALAEWFGVEIDPATLAELALAAEVEELGITAGPMDRVVQAYGGFLHMDFRPPRLPRAYVALDAALLPPLFIAWDVRPGESSGAVHDRVRGRWERGETVVVAAVERLAELADEGLAALRRRNVREFQLAVTRSFEVRASVWDLRGQDRDLVAVGQHRGAAVKLCGSGGAVVGVMRDQAEYPALEAAYTEAGYEILRPRVGSER